MPKFLTKARQRWLARTFQGLMLITSAGVLGESFLKLRVVWRAVLLGVVTMLFVLGLYFAKADATNESKEEET